MGKEFMFAFLPAALRKVDFVIIIAYVHYIILLWIAAHKCRRIIRWSCESRRLAPPSERCNQSNAVGDSTGWIMARMLRSNFWWWTLLFYALVPKTVCEREKNLRHFRPPFHSVLPFIRFILARGQRHASIELIVIDYDLWPTDLIIIIILVVVYGLYTIERKVSLRRHTVYIDKEKRNARDFYLDKEISKWIR